MRAAATFAVLLFLACCTDARAGEAAVAVTAGEPQRLVRIDTDAPGTIVRETVVGGLAPGEAIVGLDVRPATGGLYALTSLNRILLVDPATGQTSALGSPVSSDLLTPDNDPGMDFNPAADRLRLTDSLDHNLRWNPVAATVVDGDGAAPGDQGDTDLDFDDADVHEDANPDVLAVAYDRDDADPTTPTTLFAVDTRVDVLATIGTADGTPTSPNTGELFTVGDLGLDPLDASFDIASPPGGPDVGYLAADGVLHRVSLTTGAATAIGPTPQGLRGLTILPGGALRLAGATVGESAASVTVTVRRSGDSLAATRVDFRTVDGSAAAGADYTAASGTLSFARGQRSLDVTIPLLGDTAVEGEEAFALALSDLAPGAALDTAAAVVRVTDDDAAPTLTPSPEPDATAPVLLVVPTAPKSLRALRRAGRLRVPFGCSEACRTVLTLKLGGRELGSGERTLTGAGVGRVDVRLAKAGKRALRRVRARRATLTLSGLAADRANNRTTTTNRLRLRRR